MNTNAGSQFQLLQQRQQVRKPEKTPKELPKHSKRYKASLAPIVTQHARIYPNYTVLYETIENRWWKPSRPETNKANGILSQDAQKRIKNYITLIYSCAIRKKIYCIKERKRFYYKVGFITLTLPSVQKHSDKYIMEKALQKFIRTMRRKEKMLMYLWRAERQQNNNIHFHICVNVFIHHKKVRREWNNIMRKLGYIDNTVNANPPSTEIKAVRNETSLAGYLAKYIAKTKSDGSIIHCKLWDCSENIKEFRYELRYINCDTLPNEIVRDINNISRRVKLERCQLLIHEKGLQNYNTKAGRIYKQALNELINKSGQLETYNIESIN